MTDVYRNLTRRAWSVREGGCVIEHVDEIALAGVTLIVQLGGRDAVLRTGQRSVHAYARGERIAFAGIPGTAVELGYNPFAAPFFTLRPGFSKLLCAKVVYFTDTGTALALI